MCTLSPQTTHTQPAVCSQSARGGLVGGVVWLRRAPGGWAQGSGAEQLGSSVPPTQGQSCPVWGGLQVWWGPLGLVQRYLRRERGLALSSAGPAPLLGDACSPLTPQHPQKGGPWTQWVLNTLLWPQMTKRPPIPSPPPAKITQWASPGLPVKWGVCNLKTTLHGSPHFLTFSSRVGSPASAPHHSETVKSQGPWLMPRYLGWTH